MIYIIKSCVKCIYFLQKQKNGLLCRPNIDPKKNNDIESCDDTDSEENEEQYETVMNVESLAVYNFIYIMCCEMYKYLYIIAIILTYIFIFYVMIEVYGLS